MLCPQHLRKALNNQVFTLMLRRQSDEFPYEPHYSWWHMNRSDQIEFDKPPAPSREKERLLSSRIQDPKQQRQRIVSFDETQPNCWTTSRIVASTYSLAHHSEKFRLKQSCLHCISNLPESHLHSFAYPTRLVLYTFVSEVDVLKSNQSIDLKKQIFGIPLAVALHKFLTHFTVLSHVQYKRYITTDDAISARKVQTFCNSHSWCGIRAIFPQQTAVQEDVFQSYTSSVPFHFPFSTQSRKASSNTLTRTPTWKRPQTATAVTSHWSLAIPFGWPFCPLNRLCILILWATLPDQRQSVKLHTTLNAISTIIIRIIAPFSNEYSPRPRLVRITLNAGNNTIRDALAR